MAEEDVTNASEEMNEDNDAREEDIVSDVDSDTQDVVEDVRDNAEQTEARFTSIESTLERILGEISSIREAQGIMVENGAVVTEPETDMDFTDADSFVPPAELDLLI